MGVRFRLLEIGGYVRCDGKLGQISGKDEKKRDVHIFWQDGSGEDSWEVGRDLELAEPPEKQINDSWEDDEFPPESNGVLKAKRKHKPTGGSAAERWMLLNNFWDFAARNCTRSEIAVWGTLFRNSKEGTVSMGMKEIATRAGCSKWAVVQAVKSLEGKGLLRVVFRGNNLMKKTSRYRVLGLEVQG
jgi:hypothetical protein